MIGFTDQPDRDTPLAPSVAAINLATLGLLVFGVATSGGVGAGGHLAGLILLVAATASWILWVLSRTRTVPSGLTVPCLVAMAGTGGVLAGFAPLAMVFPGVAALGATMALGPRRAVPIVVVAVIALAVAIPIGQRHPEVLVWAASAMLAGSVIGFSRRAAQDRAVERMEMRLAEARADAETARAELLAGRNHMARELHDVLAHTLSGLALQIEALAALLGERRVEPTITDQVDRLRSLVREGLDEARGAVAALREDLPPLDERLAKLATERHAGILVSGEPRPLAPNVALALYRAAQEGLTNAAKHAPGAPADVRLVYAGREVTVSVSNPAPPAPPPCPDRTGGGYGLQGIRERVLLIGGRVEAGPAAGGWRVEATVPVSR